MSVDEESILSEEEKIKYTADVDNSFKVGDLHSDENAFTKFYAGEKEVIALYSNGDIFVNGKLIENDKEVVDGLRELLKIQK